MGSYQNDERLPHGCRRLGAGDDIRTPPARFEPAIWIGDPPLNVRYDAIHGALAAQLSALKLDADWVILSARNTAGDAAAAGV
jgi:hypothetical protein